MMRLNALAVRAVSVGCELVSRLAEVSDVGGVVRDALTAGGVRAAGVACASLDRGDAPHRERARVGGTGRGAEADEQERACAGGARCERRRR